MSLRKIDGMTVRTNHEFPPIPFRKFDWSAINDDTYDGGEGSPIGWGPTERDAIVDLLTEIDAMKSTPSERIRAAVLAFDPSEASVRERFAMAAGALQCVAAMLPNGETHVVHFNGRWAHLGSRSLREILDLANQALEG